jgi:hypothetical protein
LRVSAEMRRKYKLWHYEQNCQCVYCGKPISPCDFFNNGIEEDHIWPQAEFRQNYMNTVIVHKACHEAKGGKQTPWQAWGDTDQWHIINNCLHSLSKAFPDGKRKRILEQHYQPENIESFVERQLNETRYIAVAAKNMLLEIGCPVMPSRGEAVARLRRLWGLDTILPRHPEDGSYTLDKETGKLLHYDPKRDEARKNRRDHRHHAIDALVVALTDRSLLHLLIRHHQQEKEVSLQKNISSILLPDTWQQGTLRDAVVAAILPAVVSHMSTRKIRGPLHLATVYGKSYYVKTCHLGNAKDESLKDIKEALSADPYAEGNSVAWLSDPSQRELLEHWLASNALKKPKDREAWPLKTVMLARRCYTVRKPVSEETLKYAKKNWQPGKGSWIVDEQTHQSLAQWLQEHSSAKAIRYGLQHNPPRLLSKAGTPGHVIKRVTIATNFDERSIANIGRGKIVALGNNHHVEIFHNGKTGKAYQQKGRFVSMLEAAQRVSRGEAVINREPEVQWEGEWFFLMDLAQNDLVLWDVDATPGKHEDMGDDALPVYRVQKMSSARNNVDFRLHNVSSVSDKYGHIDSSIMGIRCKKLNLGNLGWTPDQPPLHD